MRSMPGWAGWHVAACTFAGVLLLAACASTSPNALLKYQPPPADAPAAVIDVGKHGHAWSVDGAETPSFAKTVRLAPGDHRVGINCLSFEIKSIDVIPVGAGGVPIVVLVDRKSTAQFVVVTGPFKAGATYYARCVATNGQPRAWLADTQDGNEVPEGFTAICTRSCGE